jgi:hypothetical protein
LIVGEDASVLEGACKRLELGALVEPRRDSEVKPAVLIDADIFACAISREVFAGVEWLLSEGDRSCLPQPSAELDLDFELGPPEYRRNAALLATIPPWGDAFGDTLDVGLAQRASTLRY